MNKLLFIIGSRNESSRNYTLTNKLISKLNELEDISFEFEIVTPDKIELNDCRGCLSCFETGNCPLDYSNGDCGLSLKSKLKQADFIIVNSPVYAHSVSGDVKRIIDRLSYWLHTFELLGKQGIVLTTTFSSGAEAVSDYLKKIMLHYGMFVPYTQNFYGFTSNNEIELMLDSVTTYLHKFMKGEISLAATPDQESFFQQLRHLYLFSDESNYEKQVWKKRGYLKAENFNDLLNMK